MAAAASYAPAAQPSAGAQPAFVASPILPLVEMERRAILNALEYTKGDRLMAAHLLGIGRTTLYRKLKEYQLGD
jgi:transcriptional regulator of acetoin/glycerol metabolism